mmetsp:Transcript_16277/g.41408  ORF Transcript_16277/g.41408 Transcript_16277/m.41408 type:complete len:212 (-) Transcript_16277:257-892(-)
MATLEDRIDTCLDNAEKFVNHVKKKPLPYVAGSVVLNLLLFWVFSRSGGASVIVSTTPPSSQVTDASLTQQATVSGLGTTGAPKPSLASLRGGSAVASERTDEEPEAEGNEEASSGRDVAEPEIIEEPDASTAEDSQDGDDANPEANSEPPQPPTASRPQMALPQGQAAQAAAAQAEAEAAAEAGEADKANEAEEAVAEDAESASAELPDV